MSENKDFLEKEPIGKLLLKLALPTLAAQFINMLYNTVFILDIFLASEPQH